MYINDQIVILIFIQRFLYMKMLLLNSYKPGIVYILPSTVLVSYCAGFFVSSSLS